MIRSLCLGALVPLVVPVDEKSTHEAERYLRTGETEEALSLEIAMRELVGEDGRSVWLIGAAHIASIDFYERVQSFLDACDVTLFEGVGGLGVEPREPSDLEGLAAISARRLRWIGRRVDGWKAKHGELPETLDKLLGDDAGLPFLPTATRDGFGHAFDYRVAADGESFELWSRGADGAPGGDGANADLEYAQVPPPRVQDSGRGEGIQKQLAGALGVVFQLDAIDYRGARWKNCDMDTEELVTKLEESGLDASQLFGMLDGSSLTARFAGAVLDLLGRFQTGQAMLRLVGIEMLGRADELMAVAPGELAGMMEILIEERNVVVVEGVRAALADPETETIGVFYGAAHLRDLEQRLVEELDWTVGRTVWLPAIEVDLETLGVPRGQVKFLQATIRSQFDLQMRMARKAAENRDEDRPR